MVAAADVAVCFPGGLFSKTEMSEVLTEIVKADPNFDKDSFLKQCEKDIIPNILEVMKSRLLSSVFLCQCRRDSSPASFILDLY